MAIVETYKTTDSGNLAIHVYGSDGASPLRPAVVFFHGGGWRGGSPAMLAPQCEALASRGIVAATAEYRLVGKNTETAVDCVRDARSALRWMARESNGLGVDPSRIAAGGGSAGGHLAACCGLIEDPAFDDASDDRSVTFRPVALALFNPAVDLSPPLATEQPETMRRVTEQLAGGFGEFRDALSPKNHVRAGCPPTLIQHGVNDSVLPIGQVRSFRDAMVAAGNRCDLIEYDGADHGFFNARAGHGWYEATLKELIAFLEDVF